MYLIVFTKVFELSHELGNIKWGRDIILCIDIKLPLIFLLDIAVVWCMYRCLAWVFSSTESLLFVQLTGLNAYINNTIINILIWEEKQMNLNFNYLYLYYFSFPFYNPSFHFFNKQWIDFKLNVRVKWVYMAIGRLYNMLIH